MSHFDNKQIVNQYDFYGEYSEPEDDYMTNEEIDRAFEEHEKWSDF